MSAAGVTLGGGLSWLSGLHGASCDNLLSANLVTADAKITQVNEQTDSELLWGLRGAGANFGVTTSFEAKVHEIVRYLEVKSTLRSKMRRLYCMVSERS